MTEGFLRLYRSLPELAIDVPQAPDAVARFTAYAQHCGVLPANFRELVEKLVVPTVTSAAVGNSLMQLSYLTTEAGDMAWMAADRIIGIWGVPKQAYADAEFAKIAKLFVSVPSDETSSDAAEAAIESAITAAEDSQLTAYLPSLVAQVGVLAATCNEMQYEYAARLLRTLVDAGTLDSSYLLIGLFRIMEIVEFAPPERVDYREAHFAVVDDPDLVVKIATWLHLMLVSCVEVGLVSEDVFAMLPEHLASRLDSDNDTDDGTPDDEKEFSVSHHSSKSMLITLQRFFANSMAELTGKKPEEFMGGIDRYLASADSGEGDNNGDVDNGDNDVEGDN